VEGMDESQVEKLIEISDFYFNDVRDLFERAGADPAEFLPAY
jgi:hypothetical protein